MFSKKIAKSQKFLPRKNNRLYGMWDMPFIKRHFYFKIKPKSIHKSIIVCHIWLFPASKRLRSAMATPSDDERSHPLRMCTGTICWAREILDMRHVALVMSSAGADLGFLLWWGCELKSWPGRRLLVAGKARHKLGGVGACSPRVPLDKIWCILRAYNYSLVSDIVEGEVNHNNR